MTSLILLGALLAGIAVALAAPGRAVLPRPLFRAAQAVTGVTLGAYVKTSSLEAIAGAWLPVLLVSVGTLALSLAAGAMLHRTGEVDRPTAALGMVAGGASGIVAMAGELGADDRLVAFMQYLRVVVIVLVMPAMVALAVPGAHGANPVIDAPALGDVQGWLLALAAASAGALVGRRVGLPAGILLGPLLLTAALALALPGAHLTVPRLLREAAFAGIGLEVGLRFTVATIRQAGRLLVPALAAIFALMALSLGLAVVLDQLSSASFLDAYLATTPGGLYAVLAVAFGSGADTTFVVAVQTLRLLAMILLAPLAVRALVGWNGVRVTARARASFDGRRSSDAKGRAARAG